MLEPLPSLSRKPKPVSMLELKCNRTGGFWQVVLGLHLPGIALDLPSPTEVVPGLSLDALLQQWVISPGRRETSQGLVARYLGDPPSVTVFVF